MKESKNEKQEKINLKYNKFILLAVLVSVLASSIYYRPIEVKANADPTLAEFVFSLFAAQGIGLSDPNILNALQTTMGQALAVGAEGIQNAITAFETATGGCDVITKTFTTTAGQAVTYVQQVGAENIIYVKEFGASAAENISAAVENYQNFGFVAPAVGGMALVPTIGSAALAVAAGVGLGFGINAFREYITDFIANSAPITQDIYPDIGLQAIVNDNKQLIGNLNYPNTYLATSRASGVFPYTVWIANRNSYTVYYYEKNLSTGNVSQYPIYPGRYATWPNRSIVNGIVDPNAYLRGNYNPPTPMSPDVVSTSGNLTSPEEIPEIEEPNYIGVIPMEVIDPWADTATSNYTNGDVGTVQGDDFQDLVTPYVLPDGPLVPQPTLIPNPDGIPTGPQTDPQPVNPAQPTFMPQPEATLAPGAEPTPMPVVSPYPEADPELQKDILKNGRLHGLENFFPFCIPFDFADLLTKLNAYRKAPVITWDADFGSWGNFGQIVIDLSLFDEVASLLRTFETILYLVALMMVTKNVTGWGG